MKYLLILFSSFFLFSNFSIANEKIVTKKQIYQMIKELEAKGILDKEGAAKAYQKLEKLTDEQLKALTNDAQKKLDKKRK